MDSCVPEPSDLEGDLSRGQLELWLVHQLSRNNAANNLIAVLAIAPAEDESSLARRLHSLLQRQAAWRTSFHERDGRPFQRINRTFDVNLTCHDCAGWSHPEFSAWLAEESARPFELSRAVFRSYFLKHCPFSADGARRNVLIMMMPHIVADFSCVELYLAELNRASAEDDPGALGLPGAAPSYLDFARREKGMLDGARSDELRAYWASRLKNPPLSGSLPWDYPPNATSARCFSSVEVELPAQLTSRLRMLGRGRSATPYVTILACYFAFLHRYTQQDDIVVGTPVSIKPKEFRSVIGIFTNILPLRIEFERSNGFFDLLEKVKLAVAGARKHSQLPLGEILRHVGLKGALGDQALFQATFAWERLQRRARVQGGAPAAPVVAEHLKAYQYGTNDGLSVLFYDDSEDFAMQWNFDSELFRAETVRRMADNFLVLLESIASHPEALLETLPLLTDAEAEQVLTTFNATAIEREQGFVHQAFEAQVARAPDAVALVQGNQSLSYADLNARANRLAHELRALGVKPDGRVAICAERGFAMLVAVLGVWKAGGAYVPLDPAYPSERLRYMLADSEPVALLAEGRLLHTLAAGLSEGVRVIDLDHAGQDQPETNPGVGVIGLEPSHLAYVIYTSGSTGMPKGVLLEHRGLYNIARLQIETLAAGPGSRILQFASFSFDGCVFEVVMALASGAELHLPEAGLPPVGDTLVRLVDEHQISHAIIPPAVLGALPETERLASIHTLISSGDALSDVLVRRFAPGRRFINGYGPTEMTVCATLHDCCERAHGCPPIGRPVANARVYILDTQRQPVPIGVRGELYIAGAGVARGYLNRSELDAERFLPEPFSGEPDARMYRTGDLGRWLGDGTIEFFGRNDQQVKIRGFRVELGEIEAALLEHPEVSEVAVIAREDAPGGKRLVAYWVSSVGVNVEALRSQLSLRLPEYMVPAAFVQMEALPLTPNGKLDRNALPAPEGNAYTQREYQAPREGVETQLAAIWCELLQVERVGRYDNFFELGGHSLLAVTLIERLRAQGLPADIRAIFSAPTLAALAETTADDDRRAQVPPNLIPADCAALEPAMLTLLELDAAELERIVAGVPGGAPNVQDIYPLGPLQEGIFFHHLLASEGDAYLSVAEFAFDSRERLESFTHALEAVVERHDVLRTALAWDGLSQPVQVVWRQARLEVQEIQLDPAEDALAALRRRFDPRQYRIDLRRAPMLRLFIARDAQQGRWLLVFLLHHLAGDHTMLEVMQHELRALLLGRERELCAPTPFRNLVAQARLGVSRSEQEDFFRRMLGDVEEPTAPFGLLDVLRGGREIDEARLEVDGALSKRLRAQARRLGVSVASVWHQAWAGVLARLTGREDVVFGTVLLGRMQGRAGAGQGMGVFINTLPLRVRVGEDGSEASVRRTQALLAELMRHEHASLALAQRCSAVRAPLPLFTTLLNYRHSAPIETFTASGPTRFLDGVDILSSQERSNYPLTLTIDDLGGDFAITAQVHESVEAARVCRFMQQALESLVRALELAPAAPVRGLDTLPEAERQRVVSEWNATRARFPDESCVHELFEAQVQRAPDACALVHGASTLSYAELNARANRLAHELRAQGVGPGARVAVYAERNVSLVVGLLAVLKAGGAYVPLDPAHPVERLQRMLSDSEPVVLLCEPHLRAVLSSEGATPSVVDISQLFTSRPASNPTRAEGGGAEQLAYVMYTSGSTGVPKGVMVEHRGLVNLLCSMRDSLGMKATDRVLSLTTVAFDIAGLELYLPLICGASIGLVGRVEASDPGLLAEQISSLGITLMQATPATWRMLLDWNWRGGAQLRALCGGEALTTELAARLRERTRELWNVYGPTETTIWSSASRVAEGQGERLNEVIGRPIANTQIYILNAQGQPAPIGVAGELFIGGAGVARGYWKRPELTAERFVPDPFSAEPAARLYKTGDLGRWLPDGTIEFLGRNDFQVKIRGFRVELGEIEARLREHAQVREAVVIAREDNPGDKRLVAYLVANEELSAEALRAHLGERLPEYMVPAAFVRMPALPLTANGKLDRKALPAPERGAFGRRAHEAPEGETEASLARIWAELLAVDGVGRHDDFFELGGHSLLATRLILRIAHEFGVKIPLGDVFEFPRLSRMSERILDAQLAQFDPDELQGVLLHSSLAQGC